MVTEQKLTPLGGFAAIISAIFVGVAIAYTGVLGTNHSAGFMAPGVLVMVIAAILGVVAYWTSPTQIPRLFWVYGALLIWLLIRVWTSPVWTLAKQDLGLILGSGAMIVTSMIAGRHPAARRLLWIGLLLLIAGNVVAAIYQKWLDPTFYPLEHYGSFRRNDSTMATGLSGHPNTLANLCCIGALLGLGAALYLRRALWIGSLLFTAGCLSAIYLAQSRGAMLGFVLGLMALLLLIALLFRGHYERLRKGSRAVLSLLGVTLVLGVVAFGVLASNKAAKGSVNSLESLTREDVRVPLMIMGAELAAESPLVGHGARTFETLAPLRWSPSITVYAPDPRMVHNDYIHLALEYGLPALLLLLIFLGGLLVKSIRQIRSHVLVGHTDAALELSALVAALVGFLVHSAIDFPAHVLPNLMVASLCMGLILSQPAAVRSTEASRRAALIGGAGLIGILLLFAYGASQVVTTLRASAPLMAAAVGNETGPWSPPSEGREATIALLEDSLKIQDDFRRRERLALCHFAEAEEARTQDGRLGHYRSAEAHLRAAVAENPRSLQAQTNLALVTQILGRHSEAEELWKNAAELGKYREYWSRGYQGLGQFYLVRAREAVTANNGTEAITYYQKGIESVAKAADVAELVQRQVRWAALAEDLRSELASIYGLAGRHLESYQLFQTARGQAHWGSPEMRALEAQQNIQWGEALWMQRKPEAAGQLFKQALFSLDWVRRNQAERFTTPMSELLTKAKQNLDFLKVARIEPSAAALQKVIDEGLRELR